MEKNNYIWHEDDRIPDTSQYDNMSKEELLNLLEKREKELEKGKA